jgi:hypothetical protein
MASESPELEWTFGVSSQDGLVVFLFLLIARCWIQLTARWSQWSDIVERASVRLDKPLGRKYRIRIQIYWVWTHIAWISSPIYDPTPTLCGSSPLILPLGSPSLSALLIPLAFLTASLAVYLQPLALHLTLQKHPSKRERQRGRGQPSVCGPTCV